MTVWFIVLVANSGHRVELPRRYDTEKECYAAVAELERTYAGSSASCVARQVQDPRPYQPPPA